MRFGELLAIRWGDIDFNHKEIILGGNVEERPFLWVKRSFRRGKFAPPKNGKNRKVDISRELRDVLERHLINEKKKALKEGRGELPELLFHREEKAIEQNYLRRIFKRILVKAKLREIKFHGMRHTYASLLLSKGVSPVYVKEQLGHSSIQITVDIYGKWIQTVGDPAVNQLDAPTGTLYAPTEKEKAVTGKDYSLFPYMVPKARLELAQAYTH